jgi:hypothetical protein
LCLGGASFLLAERCVKGVATSGRSGHSQLLYEFEAYVLDTTRRELRRGSVLVSLEPQVFDFLEYLIRNRQRVVTKDDLVTRSGRGALFRNPHSAIGSMRLDPPSTTMGRISGSSAPLFGRAYASLGTSGSDRTPMWLAQNNRRDIHRYPKSLR